MNLLFIAPSYPHKALPYSGAFNERSAVALKQLGACVHVLAPRPLVPPLFGLFARRWQAYQEIRDREEKNGITVLRPRVPVVPFLRSGFWLDGGAFLCVYRAAQRIRRQQQLDAVLSFDLVAAGGIAWRIAKALNIPAAGWATGGDLRFPQFSPYSKIARRALKRLDLIFYQSAELRDLAATLLGTELDRRRHVVLPRGIALPPRFDRTEARNRVRAALGVKNHEVLVLSLGRLSREKGIYELLESCALAAANHPALVFRFVGAAAAFDDSERVARRIETMELREKFALRPACAPEEVWHYLCAADIFAFASHREGMPNSLLEAMAVALPSVAFAIPPVLEIDAGGGALWTVPAFDKKKFADALIALAGSPAQRLALGERGRQRVHERFVAADNMREALARLSKLGRRRLRAPQGAVSNPTGASACAASNGDS